MQSILISPLNQTPLSAYDDNYCQFQGNDRYPILDSIPILISENNSLFRIADILVEKPQTQNKEYSNTRTLKNFVRASLLPKLNKDWSIERRYHCLAEKVVGGRVLIIGSGSKIDLYKRIFAQSEVIASDVHAQFRPDVVFDVHSIPFRDASFDLVIAAQVFEHTIQPWVAAKEIERVAANNGLIQIEVPFAFPYHGAPYDFFRFTFTGLRSLFRASSLTDYSASEGIFAAAAVCNAQALLEISSSKYVRYFLLLVGRFLFFGLKYVDLLRGGKRVNDFSMPKGYCMTFQKDGKSRSDQECLVEFWNLFEERRDV